MTDFSSATSIKHAIPVAGAIGPTFGSSPRAGQPKRNHGAWGWTRRHGLECVLLQTYVGRQRALTGRQQPQRALRAVCVSGGGELTTGMRMPAGADLGSLEVLLVATTK